jgi:threonyl-tRNA synthetase
VRLAEFGTVYRWEQSGELGGMTRVRGFTQDDAHIFCTPDQVAAEVTGCLDLVKKCSHPRHARLPRPPFPARPGERQIRRRPRKTGTRPKPRCARPCKRPRRGLHRGTGEAAFYGPKIDFVVKDVIGRDWQLGTVQVDYNLPVRFDLSYTGADNQPHRPVMIHRAPFGSLERFTGLLIEHFEGKFPTLARPRTSPRPADFRKNPRTSPKTAANSPTPACAPPSTAPDKIGAKIRNARLERVPYMLVIGQREADEGTVSVRHRDKDDLGAQATAGARFPCSHRARAEAAA